MATEITSFDVMGGRNTDPRSLDITEAPFKVDDNGIGLEHTVTRRGAVNINCAAGGDITLTAAQAAHDVIRLTGAPGAGFNVVLPSGDPRQWTIINTTGQTATVKKASGTTIAVATVKNAIVFWDGTNVVRITADT